MLVSSLLVEPMVPANRFLGRSRSTAFSTVSVIADFQRERDRGVRKSESLCGPRFARSQPGLLSPQEFIRLGSLSKLSGKGLQQRMFFLVSGESCLSSLWSVVHRAGPLLPLGGTWGAGGAALLLSLGLLRPTNCHAVF